MAWSGQADGLLLLSFPSYRLRMQYVVLFLSGSPWVEQMYL